MPATYKKRKNSTVFLVIFLIVSLIFSTVTGISFVQTKTHLTEYKTSLDSAKNTISNYEKTIDGQKKELDALQKQLKEQQDKVSQLESDIKNMSIAKNGQKICYLTFDDGPSDNTLKVLDVLKKYNVKATFFVTAQFPSKLPYLKNIADAGHSIGIHTYSHDYEKIYANEANFFNDLYKMQKAIKDQTGITSTVTRFPGGASNTLSKSYSKGIMTRLTKSVEEKGFTYFDWNCDSGDANSRQYTPEQMVDNVKRSAGSQKHPVLLMHDTAAKNTTVAALPGIIEHFKSKGYKFEGLTPSSPKMHHSVNN